MAEEIHQYYFSWRKKIFDFVFGFLLFFLTLPLMLLVSGLILFTSGKPIFFLQKRTGKAGRSFIIYKFRTMYVGADRHQHKFSNLNQAPGPMFKIFEDPRFVGIGRFLSKTGLDELPQIFNIIKGEMSFVGPRPLPVREVKKLKSNWHFRHQVKPGIFSQWTLAQNRHSSLTNWLALDHETLKGGGWFHDLHLIFSTLTKVLIK